LHFIDTNRKPLDLGSQKLFERNDIPKLESLNLGEAKAIKYKKRYHIALPISKSELKKTMTQQ